MSALSTRFFHILLVSCALCPTSLGKLVDFETQHAKLGADGGEAEKVAVVAHKDVHAASVPQTASVPQPAAMKDSVAPVKAVEKSADIVDKASGIPGPFGDAIRDGTVRKVFLVINTMLALAVASGLATIILRHVYSLEQPAGQKEDVERLADQLRQKAAQQAAKGEDSSPPAPAAAIQETPQAPAKAPWTLKSLGPFVLVWYCFFSVSHTFFQHRSGGVNLSPVVPTIIIYVFKLFLAVGMFVTQDGTLKDLWHAISSNVMVVVWYSLPAACLAFYDVFSFLTLARMAPSQYQILLHLRTVLIALCWQVVMGKRLSFLMWGLLTSCIYAALLTERSAMADILATGGIMAGLGQYTTLGVQYTLSITGNLSNEFFLTRVKLTVNAQNTILYSLGTMILCTSLVVGSIYQGGPMFKISEVPKVFDPNVMMSILTLTLVGISTGFVLKLMGNIWKELAGMVVTFVTASLDWFVFHNREVGPIDIQALVIISCSLTAFSLLEKSESAALAAKQKALEGQKK